MWADYLSKKWAKPVLVVNMPGGGGVIGSSYVHKQSKPDGYTACSEGHTANSLLVGAWKTPPLLLKDRKYVGCIIVDPMVFAVKVDAPWKTFKEFAGWVKAQPGDLLWATVGAAGPSRYATCDFLFNIGVDPAKTKMIITQGASESMIKLAGGHITLAVHSVAEVTPLIEAGKIRPLAVLSEKRSPFMPNVPTAEEQGVIKGVRVRWWGTIGLPAKVPEPILKKWESTIAEMVKDPTFLSKANSLRMAVYYLNSAQMHAFVEEEAAFYTKMAEQLGIRK
jgi:tripartite-type tricarboxylate transporter receptor subunit TctC